MTKELTLKFEDTLIKTEAGSEIKRDALYGKSKKTIEKNGVLLEKVILTPWGEIFPNNAFTNQRIDSQGSLGEPGIPCLEDGTEVPIQPSSYKETKPLERAEPKDLIAIKVSGVIPISITTPLTPGLYKTTYNYRDSPEPKDAILNVTDTQSFLLIGEKTAQPLIGKEETYDFFEEEEQENGGDEDEDTSFSMF